jgi:hypothetical protein
MTLVVVRTSTAATANQANVGVRAQGNQAGASGPGDEG